VVIPVSTFCLGGEIEWGKRLWGGSGGGSQPPVLQMKRSRDSTFFFDIQIFRMSMA